MGFKLSALVFSLFLEFSMIAFKIEIKIGNEKRKGRFKERNIDLFGVLITNFSMSEFILLVLLKSPFMYFIEIHGFLNAICFSFCGDNPPCVFALHTYLCHLIF